jgi:hypothetical protein
MVVAFATAAVSPVGAQQTPSAGDAEVLKVVTNLFDAMKAKDTARMRTALAPVARLVTTGGTSSAPTVREVPIDSWIGSIGRATVPIEEKIFSPEVRVDGNVATVWTKFEFWADGKLSHCGFDAIQLARTTSGWKIIHLADSHKTGAECGK